MTTEARLKAMLAATPEQLAAVDAVLAGQQVPKDQPMRVLRRAAVAERLGVSKRTVDALRRAGQLRAVRLPGRRNAAGFVDAEVLALMRG